MANDNLIGKTINGYEVQGLIGRGGMAAVYRAHQVSMGRTVALKVLPRQYLDDNTYIQRFQREVAIVSRLEHRSIVPVYDYGEFDGQPYIVMRYMPAGSVDQLIVGGPLPMERVLEILQQVAPALDYAHAKNVLHRDLKPSNILLDDEGAAYLTDFGIARVLGEAAGSTITTQGVVGTPAYMSPEQAQGKPLDGRSDVYALGVVLFEIATGRRPFESETPYGVAVMQVTTPPPGPRSINPALPPAVEEVMMRALEKAVDRRFQSAMGMTKALEAAWNRPDEVRETQKRHATPPNQIPYQPPPQPSYSPPRAPQHPPPYGGNPWNGGSPGQAAWLPPVEATPPPSRRRRKRGGGNAWLSLMLGLMIGCLLLTVMLGGLVYLLAPNFADLFGLPAASQTPTDEAGITPGGIQIVGTQPTRTPFGASGNGDDDADSPTRAPTDLPRPATATPAPSTSVPAATLTPSVAPIGVRPGYSSNADPTGEVVYFAEAGDNTDLYRLDVGSGRVRRLTYGARADQFPAVSPDGRYVAFVGVYNATWDLHLFNLETTGVTRLTNASVDLRGPSWSPDGAWIAFSADTRADGNSDLFRVRPDGTGLAPLLSNGQRNTSPRWFGDQIIFATGDRHDARTWELALLDVLTGDVTMLTDNDVKDWNPSWSPDGAWVLFHTEGDGGSAIVALDMRGDAGIVTVYDGPGYEWGAAYSPTGEHILFTSDMTGRDQLYVYNGGEAVPVTENGGYPGAWLPS